MTNGGWRLVVVGGPLAGAGFALHGEELSLGRSDRVDIRLDDPAVAGLHLRLGVDGGVLTLTPAGAGAVTCVAGRPIGAGRRLSSGQVFQVGHSLLALRPQGEPAPGGRAAPDGRMTFLRPPAPPPPGPSLELRMPEVPAEPAAPFRRWRRRGQTERFERGLEEVVSRLAAMRWREAHALHARWPDPAELEARASRALPGLWVRRPGRPDFLRLRVGWGDLPSSVRAVVPAGGRTDLRAEALFVAGSARLAAVPLTVDLDAIRTLAVAARPTAAAGLARWLVVQAAVLHSPRELAVAVFPPRQAGDGWAWLRRLPHVEAQVPGVEQSLLASSPVAQQRLAAALADPGPHGPAGPAVLAVVHEEAPVEAGALASLLRAAPVSRALVLWIGGDADRAPAGCAAVAEIGPSGLDLRLSGHGAEVAGVPDLVGPDYAEQVAGALSRVEELEVAPGGAPGRHPDSTVTR